MSIWKEWTTTSHSGMYTIGMRWVMDVYMAGLDHNQSRRNLTTTHSGLSFNAHYWNEGCRMSLSHKLCKMLSLIKMFLFGNIDCTSYPQNCYL